MLSSCTVRALSVQAQYCYWGVLIESTSMQQREGAPGTETVWQRGDWQC